MKKSLILIPLIMLSCKKEAAITENQIQTDSATVVAEAVPEANAESIAVTEMKDSVVNNAPATKEVLRRGVMREVVGNKIIRIADAEQLPFSIGEEFDKDGQEFILKIQNFANDKISASVKPQYDVQNIRINQIKLPNGEMDGPFGRELNNYEVPQKGEVWLIIGRSNMASGETKGNFTVNVQ